MDSILAIDTATGPCSVALWKNGDIAAYDENLTPSAQSACLFPMIERLLTKSACSYRDLGAVACTVGPGSFTGIRVGLAAAQGIAFACGIPGLGFTTLSVMGFGAGNLAGDLPVLVMLNAGKKEVYYQSFVAGMSSKNPRVGTLAEAHASMPVHYYTATNIKNDQTNPKLFSLTVPRADTLAELAVSQPEKALALTPYYIRLPDAKLPTKTT